MARAEVSVSARVVLAFASPAAARAIGAALAVDNPAQAVAQKVVGARVVLEVGEGKANAVRETLDDWLRCAAAAQGAVGARRAKR